MYQYQYSDMYFPGMYNSLYNQIPVEKQEDEDSFGSAVAGGLLFMAPIQGRHVIAHPLRSLEAVKKTNEQFAKLRKLKSFQNLSSYEQGVAYQNIFRQNQLGYKVGIKGYRNAAQTQRLTKELNASYNAYIRALRSGNKARIAESGARMGTILEQGQRGAVLGGLRQRGYFGGVKSANTVITAANKAGREAAMLARTSKTAANVSRGARALAWGKSAFKTGGGVGMAAIEGALEIPEVWSAFSEGGFSEGVVQTAKSAVNVGGSVAGWCAGAKAGAAAGAAVGTFFGPAGTAVGGVVGGIVGGISGSWLGKKVAGWFTGKSYSKKKKEAQTRVAQMPPQMVAQNVPQQTFQPSFSGRGVNPMFGLGNSNPYLPSYQETAMMLGGYC